MNYPGNDERFSAHLKGLTPPYQEFFKQKKGGVFMVEFIYEWAALVNCRHDLLPTWRERKLEVVIQIGHHAIFLLIDQSGVHFKSNVEGKGHVLLKSSANIMKELFTGETKLTSLPDTLVNVQGTYRNVLFMESLLLLSK